jgi:hypothetical protein
MRWKLAELAKKERKGERKKGRNKIWKDKYKEAWRMMEMRRKRKKTKK